jgi:hypothetical protein
LPISIRWASGFPADLPAVRPCLEPGTLCSGRSGRKRDYARASNRTLTFTALNVKSALELLRFSITVL